MCPNLSNHLNVNIYIWSIFRWISLWTRLYIYIYICQRTCVTMVYGFGYNWAQPLELLLSLFRRTLSFAICFGISLDSHCRRYDIRYHKGWFGMGIYIYIYIYIYFYIYIFIYIYLYIYIYVYLSIFLSIYLPIYLSLSIYRSIDLSIYRSINIYIYTCKYIYIYMYIYIYVCVPRLLTLNIK